MPKDAIPTSRREEQHWTSFRSAVVCLQQKLGEQMSEDPPVDDAKCGQIQHCYIDDEERDDFSVSSDILGSDTQQPQLVSVQIQHGSSASSLHNNPQEEESTNNNNRNNNNNSNKNNSSTHRFDFSGLEEVNKSICSNNNTIEELMVSPLNAETNTSQTATVALSLAESQLAEMKLKLAMTESERDELEFELMKSKG
ncbi:predicted protein [Thalassiosira pseudonana CCMP1335]|uniref:Uncharacterized protein n=1 Tax=Thalassiosira pseudonana TaxID=35128 RepID=B8BVS1_THAPS|nr:predicted protein [Thalassiosira pseudonana CCMP1335]EED95510.1 predicted protein [Thalassiosira pseudonana CCMP1335]|eukprot:scaffold6323_cov203-Alexandrium_tamarense.AAC.20